MKTDSLAEQLFFTTVRIDTVDAAGKRGAGTGFFFSHKSGEATYRFIVTNKHVAHGMSAVRLTLLKRDGDKPLLGNGFSVEIPGGSNAWHGHPDPSVDIAVMPLSPLETQIKQVAGVDVFYRLVASEMIPTAEQVEAIDAIEEVTFVGYPNGIWDCQNLLPVARRGTTASPFAVDFENTPRFLIDASVFGGSSGSPVFIFNQGVFTNKRGAVLGSRLLFVGVIAKVYFRTELNEVVAVPVPTLNQPMARQHEMLDLGVVFKARTVVETIENVLSKVGNG